MSQLQQQGYQNLILFDPDPLNNLSAGNENLNLLGSNNTALGIFSLNSNNNTLSTLTGNNNTGVGYQSGGSNTSGINNTYLGYNSGYTNTSGSNNTFLGASSTASVGYLTNSTAVGYESTITKSNQIVLGGDYNEEVYIPNGQNVRFVIGDLGFYLDEHGITFPDGSALTSANNNNGPIVCFLKDSLIATKDGYLPIQKIKPGMEVFSRGEIHNNETLVPTPQCTLKKVIWVSHYKCSVLNKASRPICFKKGCFGENKPFQDLYLSPNHAVVWKGRMRLARDFVNKSTVVQDKNMKKIVYYHIELENHSSIFSNGILTESYRDVGNRSTFEDTNVEKKTETEKPLKKSKKVEPGNIVQRNFVRIVKRV